MSLVGLDRLPGSWSRLTMTSITTLLRGAVRRSGPTLPRFGTGLNRSRSAADLCLAAHQNILEFWRRNCNEREIAEGIRPAPDLPQGPGAINLAACQPHPAVVLMTTAFATSSARNATPCSSVTSVSRAPPPQVGSVAAPVPSSPPRSLPWTSRNSRPRSSPSSAGSGSSLPSWPPLHTPRKLSHLPSPSACCASPLPASTLGPVPHGIAPSTIGPVALTQRQCGLRHPHQPPAGLQHKHGAAAKALSATKASVITRVRRVQRMRNEERQGVE